MRVDTSSVYPVENGDNIILTCTTNIDTPDSYEWYKDGTKVASANDQSIDIGNSASANGEYKCVTVKGSDKSGKSGGRTIDFNSELFIVTISAYSF